MPSFKYAAKTQEGKTITGTVTAATAGDVVGELRRKNLVVIDIREGRAAGSKSAPNQGKGGKISSRPGRPSGDELVVFTRQLATMISAGITLLDSLEILAGQIGNPRFRRTVQMVADDVRAGADFSAALAKHSRAFQQIYVSMVRAGEVSGQLDEILARLAEYLENSARLKREIKAAMTYPVISLVMVVGITMFLMIGIVPQFKPIFTSLEIKIPALTQNVMATSDWLVEQWYTAIALVFAGFFALRMIKKTQAGGRAVDWLKLKVPIFGPLFKKVALGRFSQTFATLLKSGVPILGSLEIVAETAGNKVIEEAVLKARESVRNGNSLSEPLEKSPVFPPMVTRMIAIGEKSGSLEQLLEKIATFYDEQVSSSVKSLTSMIEPLLIGFMGFLVGGIVLAVFLPIFEIQKKLTQGG